jgi:hypothetical protein
MVRPVSNMDLKACYHVSSKSVTRIQKGLIRPLSTVAIKMKQGELDLTFCGRLSGQPRHSSVVKQVDCRGYPAKCFILASRRE